MAIQEKELHPIDQNLFRFNVMYQLRQVESNRALLYKENEKQVLEVLLKSCRDADGSKYQIQSVKQATSKVDMLRQVAFDHRQHFQSIASINPIPSYCYDKQSIRHDKLKRIYSCDKQSHKYIKQSYSSDIRDTNHEHCQRCCAGWRHKYESHTEYRSKTK